MFLQNSELVIPPHCLCITHPPFQIPQLVTWSHNRYVCLRTSHNLLHSLRSASETGLQKSQLVTSPRCFCTTQTPFQIPQLVTWSHKRYMFAHKSQLVTLPLLGHNSNTFSDTTTCYVVTQAIHVCRTDNLLLPTIHGTTDTSF